MLCPELSRMNLMDFSPSWKITTDMFYFPIKIIVLNLSTVFNLLSSIYWNSITQVDLSNWADSYIRPDDLINKVVRWIRSPRFIWNSSVDKAVGTSAKRSLVLILTWTFFSQLESYNSLNKIAEGRQDWVQPLGNIQF